MRKIINYSELYYCISGQCATEINGPGKRRDQLLICSSCKAKRNCCCVGEKDHLKALHHSYTFTIWTDPGRTVAYPPFIFLKTFFADHKTTRATPAELLFFFTAMAAETSASLLSVPLFTCCFGHLATSLYTHSRYSLFTSCSSVPMISGKSYGWNSVRCCLTAATR